MTSVIPAEPKRWYAAFVNANHEASTADERELHEIVAWIIDTDTGWPMIVLDGLLQSTESLHGYSGVYRLTSNGFQPVKTPDAVTINK